MIKTKKKVLFVGSFKDKAKDGSVGGQMFACRSLIQSGISESIEWILLDTTGNSVPPPKLYIRFFNALKRLVKFIYLIISKKPDTVLIFSANGPSIYEKGTMVIFASLLIKNVILAPRGGPLDNEIEHSYPLRMFIKCIFSQSKYIICQGEYWREIFSTFLPEKKIEKLIVIPNWIDENQYNLNEEVTFENDGVNILFMGWIIEEKGIFDIFTAITLMNEITRKVNFYFLGDGSARKELIKLVDSGKYKFNFFFPGWVYGKEKLRYLLNTDIFVLPSHFEGLPNSLMEAMVCNIACIATNVGSVSDLIINGETGLLIEKKDCTKLALGLTSLIENKELRTTISKTGRDRILTNYSITSAINKFNKIL